MGMDVYGCNATSERGFSFRNNNWWWQHLWRYCEDVAPEIIPEDNLGHFNDGWGLDDEGSEKLAQRLTEELVSRRTIEYEIAWTMAMEERPDEVCKYCDGTGERVWKDEPHECNPLLFWGAK